MVRKVEDKKRALFFQRVVAFVLDVFIVSIVVGICSLPFSINKNEEDLNEKTTSLVQQVSKQDITIEEFLPLYENLYYQNARSNGFISLLTIIANVIYFIVFQTYQNGQTIGKKLMKIRVISEDGDLFMNQMIFRSMLANFILFDLILFVCMLVCSKSVFFYSSLLVEAIELLFLVISILMIMIRKDGCSIHDKLVHTRVVQD